MDIPGFIDKYFYVIAFVVSLLNYLITKRKIDKAEIKDPDIEQDLLNLIKKRFIMYIVPILVMALGMTLGKLESLDDFFTPGKLNPYIIVFWILTFIITIFEAVKILFGEGLEEMNLLSRTLGKPEAKALPVKVMVIILLLVELSFFYLLFFTTPGL